jgi:hypothetical protein
MATLVELPGLRGAVLDRSAALLADLIFDAVGSGHPENIAEAAPRSRG